MVNAQRSGGGVPGLKVITVSLAVLAGCEALPHAAVQQIKQADRAYRLARFRDCERLATQVIRAHPSNAETAEAYYVRGLSRLRLGNETAAEADLDVGLRKCQRESLRVLLSVQLGHLAYEHGLNDRAVRFYGAAVNELPASVPADEVWYRYGVSLQRAGDFASSRDAFGHVAAGYSGGESARGASRKMSWHRDYFTVQCGAFSQRSAAQAAAARLRNRGLDPIVLNLNDRGGVHHVVHVGRYRDYDSALAALPAIQRIQPDAFVVP